MRRFFLRGVGVSATVVGFLACSAGEGRDGDGDRDGSAVDEGPQSDSDEGAEDEGDLDGSIDDTGNPSSGGNGNGNVCQSYTAVSKPNPPTVLILLDQSGSMKATEGSTTRWAAATSSTIDAVKSLDDRVHFGLIGFPTHVITSDSDASQTCNAHLKVAPGPDAGAAVESSIQLDAPQKGHTPVRAALNLARTELAKSAYADAPRYVVLVTDGLPNCKGIAPTSSATSGFANYEDPSDAVSALSADGVTTYVVGYNIAGLSEWSEGVQHDAVSIANNMAEAGGTGSHRSVSNGAQLQEVLQDIAAGVAPCSFELDAAPRGGASYVRASIDGIDYALGSADGWVLEGDQTIRFEEDGAACRTLRDGGEHEVSIQVECQPVQVN